MNGATSSPITRAPASAPLPASQADRLASLAARMQRTGQWGPGQLAGRRWAMGCVSLEITQRCKLDCTLCYLSESAEAMRDVPLQELLRRINEIAFLYGPDTDVGISGGDPTLRDKNELSQIVRHVRARGMRSSLFTNGILMTRAWLESLAADGPNDVAFHVDMTQQRQGFDSESALNAPRLGYIDMARGLKLSVIFNTTVFAANAHEIPALAQCFFAAQRRGALCIISVGRRHRLAIRLLWLACRQWFRSGRMLPPVRKISFFIHSFMDACQLDAERLDACVFMAATAEDPMSMCTYNAERERILRNPVMLANGETWRPGRGT